MKGVLRGSSKGAGVTQGSTVMRAEAWPKISNLELLGIKTRDMEGFRCERPGLG